MDDLTEKVTHFSAELKDAEHRQSVCVAGMVCQIRPYHTRNGHPMGFVTLEDLQGTIDLVVFARVWQEVREWLQTDEVVVVNGQVDLERGDPKVLVDELYKQKPSAGEEDARPEREPTGTATVLEEDRHPDETRVDPVLPQGPTQQGGEPGRTPWREEAGSDSEAFVLDRPPESESAAFLGRLEPPVGHTADPLEERVTLTQARVRTEPTRDNAGDPQMLTIVLRSTGDRRRDTLRMRRVHGLVSSYPGSDRFAFQVYEASRSYRLEFPSSTTGNCPELHAQLQELLGEGTVLIEPLQSS